MEENGLAVKPTTVLGAFGGRELRYTYPNGDHVVTLFGCQILENQGSRTKNETRSLGNFARDNTPPLALPYPLSVLFSWRNATCRCGPIAPRQLSRIVGLLRVLPYHLATKISTPAFSSESASSAGGSESVIKVLKSARAPTFTSDILSNFVESHRAILRVDRVR
jgi:hypothetical protein